MGNKSGGWPVIQSEKPESHRLNLLGIVRLRFKAETT
jgi:hypothetical protein